MDFKRIESLLGRYHAGETTLPEEKELRQAFQDEALAERYPEAARWFRYQVAAKKRRLAPAAARATQRRISGAAAPRRTLKVIPGVKWVVDLFRRDFDLEQGGKRRRRSASARLSNAAIGRKNQEETPNSLRPGYQWILRIAAALLIGIAAFQWLDRDPTVTGFPIAETQSTVDWSKYEVTDPEEAARILSKSLRTMSGGMRTGLKTAGQEIRKINRLTDPVTPGS